MRSAAVALCLLGASGLAGCRLDMDSPAPAADRSLVARFPGRAASLAFDSRHALHVVYVLGEGSAARVTDRVLTDAAEPVGISPPGDAVDARGENGPLLAPLPEGALLAVYSVSPPGGSGHHHHSSVLQTQISRDGGRTWSPPRAFEDDATLRSHNFTDVATTQGGAVVSWLDSRSGSQGVQTAVVRADGGVTPTRTADEKTCQCCRTALHAAADGTLWLAYRDLAPGNVRNMAYAVSRDGGQTFTPRGDVADDGWVLNGCPDSGPRFAETADGTVWLAWFNGKANAIEVASAPVDGAFGPPAVVASGGGATQAVNHPEIGTLPDGRLVVFYEAFGGGKRAIEARVSNAGHQRWSPPIAIADEGTSPRYARSGDRLRLSYTSFAGETPEVHVIDPESRLLSP